MPNSTQQAAGERQRERRGWHGPPCGRCSVFVRAAARKTSGTPNARSQRKPGPGVAGASQSPRSDRVGGQDIGSSFRVCALDGCEEGFVPPSHAPHKRFCSERHRRTAEKRRYRERHTETAWCPACGDSFTRTTTSRRLQVYCTPDCQYRYRSFSYRKRADIQEGIRRARDARVISAYNPARGAPAESGDSVVGVGLSDSVRATDLPPRGAK